MITRGLPEEDGDIAGVAVPLAAFSIIDPETLFAQVAAEKTKVRWRSSWIP